LLNTGVFLLYFALFSEENRRKYTYIFCVIKGYDLYAYEDKNEMEED
jgi:hypothetical protein